MDHQDVPEVTIATQLPTPPDDTYRPALPPAYLGLGLGDNLWRGRSSVSNAGSSQPSPPADDPLDFDELAADRQMEADRELEVMEIIHSFAGGRNALSSAYDYPGASSKASPTSSTEADGDLELELDQDVNWDMNNLGVTKHGASRLSDSDASGIASPSYSQSSDHDPFSDANRQSLPDYDDATMGDHIHDENIV